MRVEIKDDIRIIKNHSHSLEEIAKLVEDQLKSYVNLSMILDLTFNKDFKKKDIKSFKQIHQAFVKNNLSFIIVNDSLNLADNSTDLVIVPTILEAHDVIQLDNIQRELGF